MIEFFRVIFAEPVLILSVALAFLMMLVNGWTDAPVAVASAVTSGALSPKFAVRLAAGCNFFGAVSMALIGNPVAKNIFLIVSLKTEGVREALIAAMITVVVWALAALMFGIPTSESHALISGLLGGILAISSLTKDNIFSLMQVVLGLFLSTVPVVIIAKFFTRFLNKHGANITPNTYKRLQVFGAIISSAAHGAQDGQKFAGMLTIFSAVGVLGGTGQIKVPFWAVVISAAVISFGMIIGGRKIIVNFKNFSPIDALSCFSADFVSAVATAVLSVLGVPISTTHSKTSAIFGASMADNRLIQRTSNKKAIKTVVSIVSAWALTFPVCIGLSYLLTKIFVVIF